MSSKDLGHGVGTGSRRRYAARRITRGQNIPQKVFTPTSNNRVRGAGRKTLRDRILSRPLVSPPPRLRRLGVRQVDDSKSVSSPTTTECSYEPSEENNRKRMAKSEAMDLLRKLAPDGDYSMISPSSRQLEKFLESQAIQPTKTDQSEIDSVPGTVLVTLNPIGRNTVLKCPVCDKIFLSFHGHDLHLDQHDSASIKCWQCNLRFSSNKSLLQHQRLRHNKRKEDELHAGLGFHNIIFADFSCEKYPAISQSYCEKNSPRPANTFHDYACTDCNKSFPVVSALNRHINEHHYTPSKFICNLCHDDYKTKAQLEQHKHAFTSKKHINDGKRRFIRALSLIPKCAAQSLAEVKEKTAPPVNWDYYEKLQEVQQSTQLFYESEALPDHEDSDSSHSSEKN